MKKEVVQLPKSLPDCRLVSELAHKANARHDIDFNFIGNLDKFHQDIRAIVGQINLLFPQYTPHDDQYHLRNLFHVADVILGSQQIESMNSVELFVLACSIYGHDWGMAISDSEKDYIVTGQKPECMTDEERRLLQWDRDMFSKFALNNNLYLETATSPNDIDLSIWQEYVRQTHAIRSGKRTEKYFDSIDGGIAEAIMRICESHTLTFEELKDPIYPVTFSILREQVNLRALAIYLRLIDLFDLAKDRTPYVLWKYVAPRNSDSTMEWAKHRALQPVTCSDYLGGRSIHVDGSTNDYEVFAALEDLRQYCEVQLKNCNDILSRMNDPRHKLDLYKVYWSVAARGFKPVSIQFDFDRESMFDIISDEIYQNNSYVFLRELLQNSIDAIKFRRAIFERKGISANIGKIQVTVEHCKNGDVLVIWKDDGVGMDEYIVRNYFAVAGKSYYRSKDFEREGFEINPISYFGIGIFSCFMVANGIEIETFKEPYLAPTSPPLKISIPSKIRQFRIETLVEGLEVGTTIKISLKANKIPYTQFQSNTTFNVTKYLRKIAGFVEYPILINEDGAKNIILHPSQDPEQAKKAFGEDYEITTINLHYPWRDNILPQKLNIAKKVFSERRYDLRKDFGLKNVEGVLTCLIPSENTTDFLGKLLSDSVDIIAHSNNELIGETIQWFDASQTSQPKHSIYKDGILVPDAFNTMHSIRDKYQFKPLGGGNTDILCANLSESKQIKLNLTRSNFVQQDNSWIEQIYMARVAAIKDENLDTLIKLEPRIRLYQLARLCLFNNINPKTIFSMFPKEHWPIPFLDKGILTFKCYKDVLETSLYLPPIGMREQIASWINSYYPSIGNYEGILTNWIGEPCIALFNNNSIHPSINSITIAAINNLYNFLIDQVFYLATIRFLEPAWENAPPLVQPVYKQINIPTDTTDLIDNILTKTIENPLSLDNSERILLIQFLQKEVFFSATFSDLPAITYFPEPYKQFYGYGSNYLNMEHQCVQTLFRNIAQLCLLLQKDELSRLQYVELVHILGNVIEEYPQPHRHSPEDYNKWIYNLKDFGIFCVKNGIATAESTKNLIPAFNDFVPGSFEYIDINFKFADSAKVFGQVL